MQHLITASVFLISKTKSTGCRGWLCKLHLQALHLDKVNRYQQGICKNLRKQYSQMQTKTDAAFSNCIGFFDIEK